MLTYLSAHPQATIREIVDGCELGSTSVANYYLDDLADNGYVTREKHRARKISITAEGWRVLGKCPVCPTCGQMMMGTIA